MLRRNLLALAAVAVAAACLTPLESQSPRERDLAEIRREIERLEGDLRVARARERTLAEALATAELDLELQARRVAEAAAARGLAEDRAAAAAVEVD
ncbi:MAG TPA: hypothetical protein VMR44_09645, partial [Thermoanaerobaculia bacterium]|nr:hypothetical protein [Thermoanaerobaculia bacterium]